MEASDKHDGWTTVEVLGDTPPPSARSLHASALINGSMYVFGGYDGTQRVNTFHSFSFKDKRWSVVLPAMITTTATTTTVANSSPLIPSARDRHIAVAFGNSFYIFGGFDGTNRIADLWGFDFSSMTWRQVTTSHGRPPSPRHSHAGVVHNHSLYIFGGYDGAYKSDLHEFDFTLSRWSLVQPQGRRPRARYRTTAVVHKNNMIIHAGHDGTRHLSDTCIFNFDTLEWFTLQTDGIPPQPRDSHISVIYQDRMFVFGGSGENATRTLHELQLPTGENESVAKWREVKISEENKTDPLFCHVGVVYDDCWYVFGGFSGRERLNDFRKFDFALHDLSFEIPESTILSDMKQLVNNEMLSDVSFLVENQKIAAHKILLVRCPYFESLFMGSMMESTLDEIPIKEISHDIFIQVLEYIYTDTITTIALDDAMELFQAADRFLIPRLKTMCEKRMLQSIAIDNAPYLLLVADRHSAMALRDKTKRFILSNYESISKTEAFAHLVRTDADLALEVIRGGK